MRRPRRPRRPRLDRPIGTTPATPVGPTAIRARGGRAGSRGSATLLAALGAAIATLAVLVLALPALVAGATPPAGPPYPDAVTGQRVYDYAGIFSASERSSAEATIRTIEDRTGAQIAVYTQVKPASDSLDKATADALALMNQWGVGRKGFDDGLVILFDMQPNLQHGQVSLYAGSGFRAVYLTDSDRQAIFDNDMKPLLKAGAFDAALTTALDDIDAAATPEHADELNRARIFNAGVGIGCLILALVLIVLALVNWYRVGRDPIYTTDSSVLMPAPPPGLTPAMATLLISDRTSKRTVSAALVDLASQGLVHFELEKSFLKSKTKVGARGDWRLVTTPEGKLCHSIASVTEPDGYVDPNDRSSGKLLASGVKSFKSDLEELAVLRRWLRGKPSMVTTRWAALGVVELIAAWPLISWSLTLEASGGLLGGGGLIVAGIATIVIAYFMPSRTMDGAMLRAMLLAYRQTLKMTLDQSSSMNEVVARKPLPWVTTPDAATAWGVAFGLDKEIDGVMRRTVGEMEANPSAGLWAPVWYSTPGHASFGGGGGSTAGLYSAGMIPDLSSMVSTIGSIGSTGSSSGGGGFGGGGGGGGGGAGGGF
jgi:uncharacterized membrane protein YgcG